MTPALTKRQREVLEKMASGSLIVSGIRTRLVHTNCDSEPLRIGTWLPLMEADLVSKPPGEMGYSITEAGRKALEEK